MDQSAGQSPCAGAGLALAVVWRLPAGPNARLTAQRRQIPLVAVVAVERPDARGPVEPVQLPSVPSVLAAVAAVAVAQPGQAAGAAVPLIVARAVAGSALPVLRPEPTVLQLLAGWLARVSSRRQVAPVLDAEAWQEEPAVDG